MEEERDSPVICEYNRWCCESDSKLFSVRRPITQDSWKGRINEEGVSGALLSRNNHNKQPLEVDLEEGLQETNATFNEPKTIWDQDKEHINEPGSDGANYFPSVTAMVNDQAGPDTLVMFTSKFRFLWPYSVNHKYCCIYRVPCRLRNVRPDAYTPQMLLIGPLSKKPQIMELSKNDSRHLEYEKMEQHKKKYLENFALMYGNQTVEEFIRIIVRDEQIVRACYAESTDWISSEDFVEMMLVDSVFILVFLKQTGRRYIDKTGDFLFDESCHRDTIFEDLLLLENQLPFSLLENLFGPFFIKFGDNLTFRDFIIGNFGFKNKIKPEVNFLHITDMFRCVRVEKLGLTKKDQIYEQYSKKFLIKILHNADELDSAGVDIVGNKIERGTSFAIKFERGVLTMPCFPARGHTERLWRNIMALEQCHYTYAAYVCHYIAFLDFLIDTEQDVELLVNKGIYMGKSPKYHIS
ncbi:hypothetical protein DY000_02029655, partial [Brassica cretica]